VEAVGAARDGADLAVESLAAAVREARGDVAEDAIEVLADRAGDPLERREPGVQGPADPVEELLPGDSGLAAAVDVGEGLLEQVGAVQGSVVALDEREPLGLRLREVPRVLLQGEAGLLDRGTLVGAAQPRICSRTWSRAS
jgi:hypothetical protein